MYEWVMREVKSSGGCSVFCVLEWDMEVRFNAATIWIVFAKARRAAASRCS